MKTRPTDCLTCTRRGATVNGYATCTDPHRDARAWCRRATPCPDPAHPGADRIAADVPRCPRYKAER